jgi:DNA-binding HxlR family transcriptional regulator
LQEVSKESSTTDIGGIPSLSSQLEIFIPKVMFARCPIKATLGVLGRKWAMLILRDIGFRKIDRFNRLLESIHGLTPRVLSMRLKELEETGYIECIENRDSPMVVRWGLTAKGVDVLPILLQFIGFGSKWLADEVFDDKRPRTLNELFEPTALKLIHS